MGRGATVSRPRQETDACADASLPVSAENEPEEGQDQDDDDDQAAAVGSAAIDPPLPLIPEFAFGGHLIKLLKYGRRTM